MSLFDSASLVVTPNGYKEDKLYSIKPTDGSGDLVVTRATTATRVNSAGLVELVPYNLATYSNTFTNGVWTNLNQTLTANTIANPVNGAVDAYTISLNSGTSAKVVLQSITQIGTYTQSVYVKANTHNFIQLLVGSDTSPYANFDIVNGTYNAYNCTATITNVGNGWFRCTITYTTSTGSAFYIWAVDSLTSARASNSSSTGSYYAYGFQLVTGTSAKEYFPTTDRLDIPRLDYTNSTCPSILVEPQRTNLITYSEQFDNAAWFKGGSGTITANNIVSPDGNTTADRLNSAGDSSFGQSFSLTNGVTYTWSVWLKAGSVSSVRLYCTANSSIPNVLCSLTSEWQRFTLTFVANQTGNVMIGGGGSFGSGNIYAWGAQLEAGSYATSYIPTIASSVTRNADVISKTGISSLIGQTEGTIFLDADVTKDGAGYYPLGTLIGATSSIYIGINTFITSGNIYAEVRNTTQQALITSSVSSGRCKIALAYKSNDIALYINGNLIGTDTSATIPATSAFSFEYDVSIANRNKKNFNTVALWKERLSNETLATLTTI